jgi:TolB-like protein/class 3 adenylate cyclase/Flp pilus assembly protein TadD
MSTEVKKEIQLEIAHVLFADIVGYSKLPINEQHALVEQLGEIVRSTDEFQAAEAAGRLLKIPTGDGMALIFYHNPEAPVECALEIARALKEQPELRLRMGVHSGPVSGVVDVNGKANVAGAGINLAQRVMDCGDAGHILLSKHAAEDLEQYPHWRPHLHELGECEVKHGARISIVNLYTEELGNPAIPEKLRLNRVAAAAARKRSALRRLSLTVLGLLSAIIAIGFVLSRHQRPSGTAGPAIPAKSIAVLPFENLSEEKQNAYFADGVQDEILTYLAKIADLKVISRTSVMQYKSGLARNLREIGQQLGVAHLLEGSVQRAGAKVRVNAQLIDARNDAHLWAETYDRDLADVFAIQSEIAKTIADELKAKISSIEKAAIEKPPTTNLAAYDLYLRARALYADTSDQSRAKENIPECVRLLDDVVSRDPNFVSAWCLLSNTHGTSYNLGHDHTPERLQKANAAVQAALRVDPGSGEAHLANALYHYRGFRDFKTARAELGSARQTLPNDAQVFFFSGVFDYRQGDWPTATRNIERAVELDPRNLLYAQQMALCYQPQRRYPDELRMWERALSIVPGDGVSRVGQAGVAANARGDMKPYQETISALLAENPDGNREMDDPLYALRERTPAAAARVLSNYSPEGVFYYGVSYPRTYWEGVVARWEGDSTKARSAFSAARTQMEKILQGQPDFAAALSLLGMIDAGLGRKEAAIREGRRACELLPMSKDAVDGVGFVVNLAQVYAWTGEKDRAIEQLNAALKVPNDLHYGEMRLHPLWDVLRGDPRFEKLMEDAKKPFGPKESASK